MAKSKSKLTLADLKPVSAELELKHPITGEKLGVKLFVVGTESAEFKTVYRGIQKKRIGLAKEQLEDPDSIEAVTNEMLAACVLGWSDDEFFGSAFSKEKMIEILADPGLEDIKRQLNVFIDDRSNFFR